MNYTKYVLFALLLILQCRAQNVTDLYDFTGGSDGWNPNAPAVGRDLSLYGTTQQGGTFNQNCSTGCGTAYRLTPSGGHWTESTLYQFRGGSDGYGFTTITPDSAGSLYGVSSGAPYGGIFRLTPSAPGKLWDFSLLYEFKNGSDGGNPLFPLFLDNLGAIYSASELGGQSGKGCDQRGCGTIFQLVPPTGKSARWTLHPLYEFQGADQGGNPTAIIRDSTGAIYGTTAYGGKFNSNCAPGCGVIFRLSHSSDGTWSYKVLYRFDGAPHQGPNGGLSNGLVLDASGNLYGLVGTQQAFTGPGGGDIFQLSPPAGGAGRWTLTIIHRYYSSYPASNLTRGPNRTLYGDIYGDQDLNWGYIFQLTPPTHQRAAWTYSTLVNFNNQPYQNPSGVVAGQHGDLYSTLSGGGYVPGGIVAVVP
jgi:hypothetical protein